MAALQDNLPEMALQEKNEWKDLLYFHFEMGCSPEEQIQADKTLLAADAIQTEFEKVKIGEMADGPEKEEAWRIFQPVWQKREECHQLIRKGSSREVMMERLEYRLDEVDKKYHVAWEPLSGYEATAEEIMAYSHENGPHKWEDICEQLAGDGITQEELNLLAALMYDPINNIAVDKGTVHGWDGDGPMDGDGRVYNKKTKKFEERTVGWEEWARLFHEAARRNVLDKAKMPMLEKYEAPARVPVSSPWYSVVSDADDY